MAAWKTLDRDARKQAVLSVYKESAQPISDREVMVWLGFTDPNQVRPRITELIDAGELFECGRMVDETTGRKVRICTYKGRLCFR